MLVLSLLPTNKNMDNFHYQAILLSHKTDLNVYEISDLLKRPESEIHEAIRIERQSIKMGKEYGKKQLTARLQKAKQELGINYYQLSLRINEVSKVFLTVAVYHLNIISKGANVKKEIVDAVENWLDIYEKK